MPSVLESILEITEVLFRGKFKYLYYICIYMYAYVCTCIYIYTLQMPIIFPLASNKLQQKQEFIHTFIITVLVVRVLFLTLTFTFSG